MPFVWISSYSGNIEDKTASILSGPGIVTTGFSSLLTGDLNKDGSPDIVIPDSGLDTYKDGVGVGPWLGSTPKLMLSNGSLLVGSSGQFSGISPSFLHSAAVGDVNGDNAPDLYMGSITTHITEKAPYLLINNGGGTFTWTQYLLPDLLTNPNSIPGNHPSSNVYITEGNQYTGSNLLDFDRDGDYDLFVFASDSTTFSYALKNDGHGSFRLLPPIKLPQGLYGSGSSTFITNPDSSITIKQGPGSISLASQTLDINGDSWPDLLIIQTHNDAEQGIYYRGGKIQILINNQGSSFSDETTSRGSPGFEASSNYDSYHGTLSLFDVNRDGFKDIFALRVMGGGYETHIFLNDGSGHFSRASVTGLPTDGILVPISDDLNQATRLALFKTKNRLEPWNGGTVGACTHTVQVYSRKN